MSKPVFLIISVFVLTNPLTAQGYYTARTAPDKAKRHYEDGMAEMSARAPLLAIGFFEKAIKESEPFIDAHIEMGNACFDTQDFERAEKHYEKAIELNREYKPRVFYDVAVAEWNQDKFTEAAQHAEQFLETGPKSPKLTYETRRLAENARFAAEAVLHPVPFEPESVGEGVNTSQEEYLPSLTADGETMIFTRNNGWDENFFSSRFKDSVWQVAEALDGVNSSENEGAQSISPDGSWLVFTACNRRGDGSQGSCDLYWSQLKGGKWTTPQPFSNTINSPAWEAQPCISADGKTIFFSSDRPGGQGGKDLWFTTRQSNGKWGAPKNLGPGINSYGHEQTPFLHPDGETLYFTSDGLPGMGDNDLYLVRRLNDTTWGKPENLGYPINTKNNEGTLTISLDGRMAYFAAKRPGGVGKHDIYRFELPEKDRPKAVTYAKAKVRDAATGKLLIAKVEFIDLQTGEPFAVSNTKSDGSFLVCLPVGREYALNVSKDRYLFHSENFNLVESTSAAKPFLLDIALSPLPSAAPDGAPNGDKTAAPPPDAKAVALRNVFFEKGSAAILANSAGEIDRLVALLRENPTLNVQINGHTDNVGDDNSNLTLSENRAKAVREQLLQKGIPAERVFFKGYGESKPVDTNDTPEGRANNRRTEFVVW